MPTETKNWTQKTRDRLSASQALPFIEDVIDGKIEVKPNTAASKRLDTCLKVLNKVCPDLKAVEHEINGDLTVQVVSYADHHNSE